MVDSDAPGLVYLSLERSLAHPSRRRESYLDAVSLAVCRWADLCGRNRSPAAPTHLRRGAICRVPVLREVPVRAAGAMFVDSLRSVAPSLLLAGLLASCSSGMQDVPLEECTGDQVSVTVSDGLSPMISWAPGCGMSALDVFPTAGGSSLRACIAVTRHWRIHSALAFGTATRPQVLWRWLDRHRWPWAPSIRSPCIDRRRSPCAGRRGNVSPLMAS